MTRQLTVHESLLLGAVWNNPELLISIPTEVVSEDFYKTLQIFSNLPARFTIDESFPYKSSLESFKGYDFDSINIPELLGKIKKFGIRNSVKDNVLDLAKSIIGQGEFDIDALQSTVSRISSKLVTLDETTQKFSMNKLVDRFEIERAELQKRKYTIGDTGLDEVLTSGLPPGEITTILGATSMGKSAFGIHIAQCLAKIGKPVLYVSLEMSLMSVATRIIASHLGKDMLSLYRDNFDPQACKSELGALSTLEYIDTPSLTLGKLENLISGFMEKRKTDYAVVIVDLLTMVREMQGVNPYEYEKGMNSLHSICRKLNVHFIGIVQANREADKHPLPHDMSQPEKFLNSCRPQLHNIKNSSSIGERSRIIMSVFREKYYIDRYFRNSILEVCNEDVAEIQILKNSNGMTGQIIKYIFIPEKQRFEFFRD